MGVDTRILIPRWVSGDDIGVFLALSAGAKKEITHYEKHDFFTIQAQTLGFRSCSTPKADGRSSEFPSMVEISFEDADQKHRLVYMHLYPENGDGFLLMPRANPLWIALGKRIVKAYGGKVQFCDYSDEYDVEVNDEDAVIKKEDFQDGNEGFQKRHAFLKSVNPLTPEELMEANAAAAYKYEEDDESSEVMAFAKLQRDLMGKEAFPTEKKKVRGKI